MKKLRNVVVDSCQKIDGTGKKTFIAYCFFLIIISGLDGLGLVFPDNLMSNRSGSSTMILSGRTGIGLAVLGLFVSRSLLAAGITWIGYTVFAKQEVRLGDESFHSYQNMRWDIRTSEQVTDIYSIVDRGPYALVQQLMLPIGTTLPQFARQVELGLLIID